MRCALIATVLGLLAEAFAAERPKVKTVVLVSANAEWREVKKLFPAAAYQKQTFGEYFQYDRDTIVAQGGWGKISAAASAQYAIDRWNPRNLVNLGTCGGITGRIERYAVLAATKTIVYDIVELMGDPEEALGFYSADLDLRWAGTPPPSAVIQAPLLSADHDLIAKDIPALVEKYGALAVDWESGAIAWVGKRNQKRVLILRGVSDMVSPDGGGQAYGNSGEFEAGTARVMKNLFDILPRWLAPLHRAN